MHLCHAQLAQRRPVCCSGEERKQLKTVKSLHSKPGLLARATPLSSGQLLQFHPAGWQSELVVVAVAMSLLPVGS